jgi:hypothetical protein
MYMVVMASCYRIYQGMPLRPIVLLRCTWPVVHTGIYICPQLVQGSQIDADFQPLAASNPKTTTSRLGECG